MANSKLLASLNSSSISSIAEKLQESAQFLLSLSKTDESSKARHIEEFTATNPSLLFAIQCLVSTKRTDTLPENPFAEYADQLINEVPDSPNPEANLKNIPECSESIPLSNNDSNSTSDLDDCLEPTAEIGPSCNTDEVADNSLITAGDISTTEDDSSLFPDGSEGSSIQSPIKAAPSGLETENLSVPATPSSSELAGTDASKNDPESSTSVTNCEIETGAAMDVRSKPAKTKGGKVYAKKNKPRSKQRSKSMQIPVINFPAADAGTQAIGKQPHQRRSTLPQSSVSKLTKPEYTSSMKEFTVPVPEPLPFVAMQESTPDVAPVESSRRERGQRGDVMTTRCPLLSIEYYQQELEKAREQLMVSQLKAMTTKYEQDRDLAILQTKTLKVDQLSSQLAAKEKELYKLRCQISDAIDKDLETDGSEDDEIKWDLLNIKLALEVCRSHTTSEEYLRKILEMMCKKTRGLNLRPWSA